MYKITQLTPVTKKPSLTLSDDELLRWLRKFQYDNEFRDQFGSRTVPMTCFCDFAGVGRASVYRFMRGDRALSVWFKQRLSEAILAVQAGLRWRRLGDHSYAMNDPEQENFPRYERARRQA